MKRSHSRSILICTGNGEASTHDRQLPDHDTDQSVRDREDADTIRSPESIENQIPEPGYHPDI